MPPLAIFLLQLLLTISAVVMSIWVHMPWLGTLALAILGAGVAIGCLTGKRLEPPGKLHLLTARGCTVIVAATLAFSKELTLDCYYGVIAWMLAAAFSLGGFASAHPRLRMRCKSFGMGWAFAGCVLCLTGSYWQNQTASFYIGLLALVGLLVLCHFWFHLPGWGVQLVNTLILLIMGLLLVDLFVRPAYRLDTRPETGVKLYSYTNAKGDPDAFRRWWQYYLDQWNLMGKALFGPDPAGELPFRLRPRSHAMLFESRISINSLGFRGREFSLEKGNAYRIVTLGESTTFGCTLKPEDKPWPELLEQMIQQRLHPKRPVEVINAGVPGYNLADTVRRLPRDILPLQPDMLISYHGANGFRMLDKTLPSLCGKPPPVYHRRPLKLLANCEQALKLFFYRARHTQPPMFNNPSFQNPMESDYAQAYCSLIQSAQTNHVRLVLANYCMAVNGQSDSGLVAFYATGFPATHWWIQANAAHSDILQNLAQEHPEVCLVDTHHDLDGANENFIDVMHFAQSGRQQLAENIFLGIRKLLEEELSLVSK